VERVFTVTATEWMGGCALGCGAGVFCDSNLLDARMCIRLKKTMKFQKGKQSWNVENLYAAPQKAESFLEGNWLGWDVELEMRNCWVKISVDLC
jgi:hypothetical protein